MPILAIASSKGGVGKTTLTRIIAASAAADGVPVTVLDADPNSAFAGWCAEVYEGPAITTIAEADQDAVARHIDALARQDVGLALIDTAGFQNLAANVAMVGADAVLIPTLPGRDELRETARTVKRAQGLARAARRDIPVRVVVTRSQPRTTLARHILGELEGMDLPRLETVLTQSTAIAEVASTGRLPAKGPSAEEIARLLAELRELGWVPPVRQPSLLQAIE